MIRATRYLRHPEKPANADGRIVLAHDERHLRRKLLSLQQGGDILIDLPEPVMLAHGDFILLDDGRAVEIVAAEEDLYEVTTNGGPSLSELAWHLGNRHLAAQIEAGRILIRRDHVIQAMLEGLGATVRETVEPFQPVRGAYHAHGSGNGAGAHEHEHPVHHHHE